MVKGTPDPALRSTELQPLSVRPNSMKPDINRSIARIISRLNTDLDCRQAGVSIKDRDNEKTLDALYANCGGKII